MRKYDEDYKREAVKKIHDGQSVASLSGEPGVSESVLHSWRRQAVAQATDGVRQVIELKRRVRELEMERDILEVSIAGSPRWKPVKKAALIFGRSGWPSTGLSRANEITTRYDLLCRVTRVSPSAYHAYARGFGRALSSKKGEIGERVSEIFYAHRRRYGTRRIAAQLASEGVSAGRWLVRSQMQRLGLRAIGPRRFRPQTTDSRHTVQASPNPLLEAKNAPQRPCEVAVGDITYLPTRGREPSEERDIQLHRRLLQSGAPALSAGIRKPGGVRARF